MWIPTLDTIKLLCFSVVMSVPDNHVDIDSYSDTDSRSLRDGFQWQSAANPSPTDSSSTLNSKSHISNPFITNFKV